MSVDCWSKELYYLIIGDFFYNPGETYQPTITQLFNGEKKWGPFSMFQWGLTIEYFRKIKMMET